MRVIISLLEENMKHYSELPSITCWPLPLAITGTSSTQKHSSLFKGFVRAISAEFSILSSYCTFPRAATGQIASSLPARYA
jgi:hypothetical protein